MSSNKFAVSAAIYDATTVATGQTSISSGLDRARSTFEAATSRGTSYQRVALVLTDGEQARLHPHGPDSSPVPSRPRRCRPVLVSPTSLCSFSLMRLLQYSLTAPPPFLPPSLGLGPSLGMASHYVNYSVNFLEPGHFWSGGLLGFGA